MDVNGKGTETRLCPHGLDCEEFLLLPPPTPGGCWGTIADRTIALDTDGDIEGDDEDKETPTFSGGTMCSGSVTRTFGDLKDGELSFCKNDADGGSETSMVI